MTQKQDDTLNLILDSKIYSYDYEPSNAEENGLQYLILTLENGVVLTITPNDDIQAYDPFITLNIDR